MSTPTAAPSADARRRRTRVDLGVLATLGLVVVGLDTWLGFELRDGVRLVSTLGIAASLAVYAMACVWVVRRRPDSRRALRVIVLVALAARLVLVGHAPVLSTDVYRYVWDGRVQWHWVNPYRYVPRDPHLAAYRDRAVYPHVNRKGVLTAYPPAAETTFRLVHPLALGTVTGTKLVFVFIDLAVIVALAALLSRLRMRPERAVLYAWHPLAITEVADSGHVEVLLVGLVLGALYAATAKRRVVTGALIAAAGLVKPYALLVVPALVARQGARSLARTLGALAVTVVLAYLPFLAVGTRVVGYLPGYLREEGFTTGYRFHLLWRLERLLGSSGFAGLWWYVGVTVAIMIAVALWCWRAPLRDPVELPRRALVIFLAALVTTTPGYPWYRLLAVALLAFAQGPLLLIAAAVASSADLLYVYARTPTKPVWPLDVVYDGGALLGVAAVVWLAVGALRRRRDAPGSPHWRQRLFARLPASGRRGSDAV